MIRASIESSGHRILHFGPIGGLGIEDVGIVCKVVADDQITVAISIDICKGCPIGEPLFCRRISHHSLGDVGGLGRGGVVLFEIRNRRSAPVIHQQIHPPVFVHVVGHASHRGDGAWHVVAHECGQGKGRKTLAAAGHGGYEHLIRAGFHLTQIIRQAIAIQVIEGNRRPHRGNPSRMTGQMGIHSSLVSGPSHRQLGQGQALKGKPIHDRRLFAAGEGWCLGQKKQASHNGDRQEAFAVLATDGCEPGRQAIHGSPKNEKK